MGMTSAMPEWGEFEVDSSTPIGEIRRLNHEVYRGRWKIVRGKKRPHWVKAYVEVAAGHDPEFIRDLLWFKFLIGDVQ